MFRKRRDLLRNCNRPADEYYLVLLKYYEKLIHLKRQICKTEQFLLRSSTQLYDSNTYSYGSLFLHLIPSLHVPS